jgi:hypothetical protein
VKLKKTYLPFERNSASNLKVDHTTSKANREYASEMYESRRTGVESSYGGRNGLKMEINGVKAISRKVGNQSGNVVYKVPNINYSTAVRSSKRVIRERNKIDKDD